MFEYSGYIDRVHDGDTVHAKLDLGFSVWQSAWLRLDGIDSPELLTKDHKPNQAGEDATQHLLKLLGLDTLNLVRGKGQFGTPGDFLVPPGKEPQIVVNTKKGNETEKYGRDLGLIHFGSVDICAAMVKDGFAKAYNGGAR